jgi:hypothetical protein
MARLRQGAALSLAASDRRVRGAGTIGGVGGGLGFGGSNFAGSDLNGLS